jgi:Ca2+/H+ antiporter, TMEM165/GDT1 family
VTATTAALITSVFLASMVEFVEAFTIVLAMGITRGWKSALAGTAAAVIALTLFTTVLGYAIRTWLPEALLELVIGVLLLIFGLQWLRKAVLRSSGHKALHDEEAAYAEQTSAAARAERTTYAGIDLFGFMVSLKGVFLEGVEVVFIVLTFGLNTDQVPLASLSAAAAAGVVVALGFAVRRPLAAVPENTMKYAVGLMLTGFGTFWSVEGLGWFRHGHESIEWPLGEWTLPLVIAAWLLLTRLLVVLFRTPSRRKVTA